jgi:hypothetical protein
LADDVVGILSGRFRMERGDKAVAQNGQGHGTNVFGGGMIAALENGASLGGKDEKDASPGTGAPGDHLGDEIAVEVAGGAAAADQVHREGIDMVSDRQAAD